MNYKYELIVFVLFANIFLFGQDTTRKFPGESFHTIGISAGVNQLKEENLLPIVHTGYILNISYEYRNIRTSYQEVQLILGFSRIATDPEDITKSVNILIKPSYSYCFNLIRKPDFNFYLGPQAGGSYSLSYFPNWDDSHLYRANYFTLGTTAMAQYNLTDGRKFQFRLSIPFISFYSRPELLRLYKLDDVTFGGIVKSAHSNIQAGLWNSVFALGLCLEYQFPVFLTKTEAISYSFEYTRIKGDGGNPFQQLIHQIGLKILL